MKLEKNIIRIKYITPVGCFEKILLEEEKSLRLISYAEWRFCIQARPSGLNFERNLVGLAPVMRLK